MQNTLVDEVQLLIDRLATRLQQSIAIDARDGELIAVSRHFGDADPYRMHLLLHRTMPPGARDYFSSFVRDLSGSAPVRVPGNPRMSIEPRWCYPVGDGLAYLWIIDRGVHLPGDEIERYCRQLAMILEERTTAQDGDGAGVGTAGWLRELVLGREAAAPEPEAGRLFAVMAYCASGEEHDSLHERLKRALRPASLCGLSTATVLDADGFAVAVLAGEGDDGMVERGALEWVRTEGTRSLREIGLDRGAGLAGLASASELRALYARAAISAVLCRELYRSEPVVGWSRVAGLAAAVAPAQPPRAIEESRTGALAAALRDPESFAFDTIGALLRSDQETGPAALLHVHRTTVNYRQHQLADATGIDLAVPADRFLAFVEWLRAALEREIPADLVAAAHAG